MNWEQWLAANQMNIDFGESSVDLMRRAYIAGLSKAHDILDNAEEHWRDRVQPITKPLTDHIEELEAKLSESEALLAKAVEGLENVSRLVDNQYADRLYTQTVAGWEQCADDVKDVARTTLAELKGGKDE